MTQVIKVEGDEVDENLESEEREELEEVTPPKKRQQYLNDNRPISHRKTPFSADLQSRYSYLRPDPNDIYKCICGLCNKSFRAEKSDIDRHAIGKKHIQRVIERQKGLTFITHFEDQDGDTQCSSGSVEFDTSVLYAEEEMTERRRKRGRPPVLKKEAYSPEIVAEEEDQPTVLDAYDLLKLTSKSNGVDPYYTFGQYVGNELRKYDATTQIHVKRAINNILFEADLGKFTYDTPSYSPSKQESAVSLSQTAGSKFAGPILVISKNK